MKRIVFDRFWARNSNHNCISDSRTTCSSFFFLVTHVLLPFYKNWQRFTNHDVTVGVSDVPSNIKTKCSWCECIWQTPSHVKNGLTAVCVGQQFFSLSALGSITLLRGGWSVSHSTVTDLMLIFFLFTKIASQKSSLRGKKAKPSRHGFQLEW